MITQLEAKLKNIGEEDLLNYYIYNENFVEGKVENNLLIGTLYNISELYENLNIVYYLPFLDRGYLAHPLNIQDTNNKNKIYYNNKECTKYIPKNKMLNLTYTEDGWVLNNIYETPITSNYYKIIWGNDGSQSSYWKGEIEEIKNNQSVYYILNHESNGEVQIELATKNTPLYYKDSKVKKYNKAVHTGTIIFMTYKRFKYQGEYIYGWWLEDIYEMPTNPLSYYRQASALLIFSNVDTDNTYTLDYKPELNKTYNIITLKENNNNIMMKLYLDASQTYTEEIPCYFNDDILSNEIDEDMDICFTYKDGIWKVDMSNLPKDNFDDDNQFFGTIELDIESLSAMYTYKDDVYIIDDPELNNETHLTKEEAEAISTEFHRRSYIKRKELALNITSTIKKRQNRFYLTCDCNVFPEAVYVDKIDKNPVYAEGIPVQIDLSRTYELKLNFDLNPNNWLYVWKKTDDIIKLAERKIIYTDIPKGTAVEFDIIQYIVGNEELHISCDGVIVSPTYYNEVGTKKDISNKISFNFDLHLNNVLFVWIEKVDQQETLLLDKKVYYGDIITFKNLTYTVGKNQLQISYGGVIIDPSRYKEVGTKGSVSNQIYLKFNVFETTEIYVWTLPETIFYLGQPNAKAGEIINLKDVGYYTHKNELNISYDGVVVDISEYTEVPIESEPPYFVHELHQDLWINTKDYAICFTDNLFLEQRNKQQIDEFINIVYEKNKVKSISGKNYYISDDFVSFREQFYKKLKEQYLDKIMNKFKQEQTVQVLSNESPKWKKY